MKYRVTVFAVLACALGGHARAQTQEKKMIDRMLKPDTELMNPMQKKSFEKTGPFKLRQADDAKDTFAGVRNAYVREYAAGRSFLGIKNPWFGKKVFDTAPASLWSKSALSTDGKRVPVRKAEMVGYRDATKSANFGSPDVPTRTYVPQPAASGAVRQMNERIAKKLTIDDVRELLNKPR
jgi:hypothetical protein